jgi:glycosyltransferase involved in cell wall biosynthesis
LRSLVKYHNLGGKVIVGEPSVGVGDSDETMPYVYSAFDVYMTQSQAEGWGLPALEAMACGVPCILPNHSAFGEDGWTCNSAMIECSSTALTAPINHRPYTIGRIPNKSTTIDELNQLYSKDSGYCPELSVEGIKLAKTLPWDNTGKLFVESLECAMSSIEVSCV